MKTKEQILDRMALIMGHPDERAHINALTWVLENDAPTVTPQTIADVYEHVTKLVNPLELRIAELEKNVRYLQDWAVIRK